MSPLLTLLAFLCCALEVQARSLDYSTTASNDFPTTTGYEDVSTIARLAFPQQAAEAKMFGEFAKEHNRKYANKDEILNRFSLFAESLAKIRRYNEEAKGMTTYGVTKFADWSWDEFSSKMLLKGKPGFNKTEFSSSAPIPQIKRPASVDWRSAGIVSPIKDQGQCGPCWAFSTAAVVESMNAKAGRGLADLAEQQMVDCIEYGCDGGYLDNAFKYARDHGLPSERDYPYIASQGRCREAKIAVKLRQMYLLPQDEEKIADSIAARGPAAVGFEVGNSYQYYKGGIMSSADCKGTDFWHANAAIGYGSNFWILKNQWGAGWGERGFARLSRRLQEIYKKISGSPRFELVQRCRACRRGRCLMGKSLVFDRQHTKQLCICKYWKIKLHNA